MLSVRHDLEAEFSSATFHPLFRSTHSFQTCAGDPVARLMTFLPFISRSNFLVVENAPEKRSQRRRRRDFRDFNWSPCCRDTKVVGTLNFPREKRKKGKKERKERREKKTSHPRIAHGQRYPLPCLQWSSEVVEWEQGSGPKGPMSCRTQGWISRRPEGEYIRPKKTDGGYWRWIWGLEGLESWI